MVKKIMQSKPVLDSTIMIQKKRDEHSQQMQLCQWEDSGQVRKMIGGTFMPWGKNNNPPQYTWFGSYSKDEKIKLQEKSMREL